MAVDELAFVVRTIATDITQGSSDSKRQIKLHVAAGCFVLMGLICLLSFYYMEFTLALLIIAIWIFC